MNDDMIFGKKVLDHGYVKLIDSMGSDAGIIEAARMSTGKGFISWDPYQSCATCGAYRLGLEDVGIWSKNCSDLNMAPNTHSKVTKMSRGDYGLLDRLWRDGHSTPFEMAEIQFEVQAPIMVFREWHRHRSQSYNEFSARYAVMPDLHYLPNPSRIQKQSTTNKQGSDESVDVETASAAIEEFGWEQDKIYNTYKSLVDRGVAKELARLNTPVSRYSKMRCKTDLRNWFGFLQLRMAPGAQWEIRQYANAIAEMLKERFPKSWTVFEEHSLNSVKFSGEEIALLREQILSNEKSIFSIEANGSTGAVKSIKTKLKIM